jgi:N-methylhydantoinase B
MCRVSVDAISLEVFRNLLTSAAEEMGVALGRTAYSTNIKERRDYSCAVFGPGGDMVAQAAHIPVHLGAMTASVRAGLDRLSLGPGDIAVLNDPYLGGTHLPDVSLMAPVYVDSDDGPLLVGYVANRGHHADIGGMAPGSLPLSTSLYQEGMIIPPLKLVEGGVLNEGLLELICGNTRTPDERRGDFAAQIAAVRTGERRLWGLVARYGLVDLHQHMDVLLDYAESLTRASLRSLPPGTYAFEDVMEGDGLTGDPLVIRCAVTLKDGGITFDLTGTASQVPGCVNTPLAVTESAALYVTRALVGGDIPANDGVRRAVTLVAPVGCLVNAESPHAVSGGNVETSQRITDVMLGALARAVPGLIPAASQGTMNNLLIGGRDERSGTPFVYYETIAGGLGAGPRGAGASAVQSHMTNTLNTPVEALEYAFPLRVRRYAVRSGSGGQGAHVGGDGVVREIEFLSPAHVTIISERRSTRPYGLNGGGDGQPGRNLMDRDGVTTRIGAKAELDVMPGDRFRVETPGGGAWGIGSE